MLHFCYLGHKIYAFFNILNFDHRIFEYFWWNDWNWIKNLFLSLNFRKVNLATTKHEKNSFCGKFKKILRQFSFSNKTNSNSNDGMLMEYFNSTFIRCGNSRELETERKI